MFCNRFNFFAIFIYVFESGSFQSALEGCIRCSLPVVEFPAIIPNLGITINFEQKDLCSIKSLRDQGVFHVHQLRAINRPHLK